MFPAGLVHGVANFRRTPAFACGNLLPSALLFLLSWVDLTSLFGNLLPLRACPEPSGINALMSVLAPCRPFARSDSLASYLFVQAGKLASEFLGFQAVD